MLAAWAPRRYTAHMKNTVLPFVLCAFLAAPALAEEDSVPPPASEESGQPLFDLFERLLRGFMTEVEPQMRELERGFSALEPELQRFLGQLRDMTQYHPPEMLPNGDILIRRRDGADLPEEADPDQDAAEGDESAPDPFEL